MVPSPMVTIGNAGLICGDCMDEMWALQNESIDLILCDLPYGNTRNKWDVALPFEPLWMHYLRVIKPNGAIVLFGQGLFTAQLMLSNERMWRYNLVWDKDLKSGFLNANRQPLRQHEDICVFYKHQPVYNPQMFVGAKNHNKGCFKDCKNNNYGKYGFVDNAERLGINKYPSSILKFPKPHPSKTMHPTEKPVALLEWLIKTYTNEGETVLDNCMGSGSTGVAAVNTNRYFIGIEKDETYFNIAERRISEANNEL